MRKRVRIVAVAICWIGVWGAERAIAADGVVEIDQAAAIAGGITPGDDPGFPITLDSPGSDRLTGFCLPDRARLPAPRCIAATSSPAK